MERKRVEGRFVKMTAEERAELAKKATVGAPRPRGCRTFVRNRMAEEMPELVAALMKGAKGGSVPHVKTLLELSGLSREEKAEPKPKRRGKTFVGELLVEPSEPEEASSLALTNEQGK